MRLRDKTEAKRVSKSVPADLGKTPLEGVVRALFEVSWGRARDLVKRGKIAVEGRVVTDGTVRISAGSEIVFDPFARRARDPSRTAASSLPDGAIVHVDAHVVVVHKPSGIATVPFDPEGMGASIAKRARPGEEAALDECVRAVLARRDKRERRTPPALGVVHRIDKETSGLVVFTRTWAAKKALSNDFRFHRVHRRYLAIVHGEARAGTIATHLVEDRGDGLRGSIEHRRGRKHAVGREQSQHAITHVEVLERLGGALGSRRATLVACRLETGRTHQIRIHLSESGHPLVGERVYVRDYDGPRIAAPRLMLHAAELGFVHPADEREMRWVSALPADMAALLDSLRS